MALQRGTSSSKSSSKSRDDKTEHLITEIMCWIPVALIYLAVSLVQAQTECFHPSDWTNLMISINSWPKYHRRISLECLLHYDEDRLCDPESMLSQVDYRDDVLAYILKKTETMYLSQHLEGKGETFALGHRRIASCLTEQKPDSNANYEPVTRCFNKLEDFINSKKGHLDCAWEIVNNKVRQIFQRLKNHRLRRR